MRISSAAVIALMAVGSVFAADPWVGTWYFVSGHRVLDPIPQITMTFQANGMQFVRINGGGQIGAKEEWTAQLDGHDHSVSLTPSTGAMNQVVLDQMDKVSLQYTTKTDGKITGKSRLMVSPDGREFVRTGTSAEGNPTALSFWIRSGGAVDPANPLAGTWIRSFDKEMSVIAGLPITIESDGSDGIRYSSGSMTVSAKFDGKEYPVKLDTTWKTATVKRIDPNMIEFSMKGANGSNGTLRFAISAEGHQMSLSATTVNATGGKDIGEYKFRRQ